MTEPPLPPDDKTIPPLGFRLRVAEVADANSLLVLGKSLLSETDHFVRRPEERAYDLEEMGQIIAHYRQSPGWLMLNAWTEETGAESRPIAEGVLSLGGLSRTRHVGALGIGVLKRYWGRGIGSALMAALEQHARSTGVERLEFTVLAHNTRARDFYRRLGYGDEGCKRRSVRYMPEEEDEATYYGDEIVMAKWIGA